MAALKKSSKDLEGLARDIEAFDKKIKDDPKIASFIRASSAVYPYLASRMTLCAFPENPTLSASERDTALRGVIPSGSSPILLNLLSVLSENGRLSSAPKVFQDFHSLMAAYRGELEVVVTSAEPLDSKAMGRLDKALKATQAAEGKTLKIVNRVNRVVIRNHSHELICGDVLGQPGCAWRSTGRLW